MEVMPAEPFLLQQPVGFRYGGVLRPAATPGEETRLRARPSQFTRASQVPSASDRISSKSLSHGSRRRKYLIEVVPHHGVAFAGNVLERRAIEDVDETAAVADEAGALQEAGRDRHRRAAHAEHLPEKFLRQRDRIAVDA